MTDMFLLVYCQGEYEDYFESPEYMYFNIQTAKDKWSELILKEQADNVEYDIVSTALSLLDEEHLDKVFRETIKTFDVDFYDFTDQQYDACAKIQSNAQLYKQAGNSVSIPIVYELGKKIIEHHRRLYGNE